jgi:hypothetical protein
MQKMIKKKKKKKKKMGEPKQERIQLFSPRFGTKSLKREQAKQRVARFRKPFFRNLQNGPPPPFCFKRLFVC